MYAKNLARILGLLCQNSDVSHSAPQELEQRFDSVRRYDQLPRGRERREEKLSGKHIAAAVFGLVPMHPGWAGHVPLVLEGFRPVGGTEASFFMAETLSDVIVTLLADEEARKDFIRMTLTMAETGMNSHGGAEVVYTAMPSVASATDGAAPNRPAKLFGRRMSPTVTNADTTMPPTKKRTTYPVILVVSRVSTVDR
jgi:hypothetical protein